LVQYIKGAKQLELIRKKNNIDSLVASRSGLENKIKEREEKSDVWKSRRQADSAILRNSKSNKEKYRKYQKLCRRYNGVAGTSSRKIDSRFGTRLHPIFKKYKMHTGVDIDAAYGASIVAANNGIVIFSGWEDGYGYTVIIDHGAE